MKQYVVPIIVFVLISLGLYSISNDPKKSKAQNVLVRNVFPAVVVSVFVFVVIKYKDAFESEPMMYGNYFDS